MIQFFQNGGFPMWFILGFGLASLIGAALFARKPDEIRLGALRAMSWATAFVSFAGFVAGIAVTLAACANLPPDVAERWHVYVMMGTSESSSNLILGASMLALTWLVIAIGLRRLAVREAR